MAVTETLSSEPLKAFLNTVRAGDVRTGRVISVKDREVLVELDGFPDPGRAVGCIPHGDLTRKATGHPSEVVSIGQQLTFEVIGVDRQQERVWASAAACEDPALRAFLLGLRRGATHQGQVQSVHNFGVFVNLDGEPDQCTGFIRIPELSWRSFDHPADVVTAGSAGRGRDHRHRLPAWTGPAVTEACSRGPAPSLRGPSRPCHHRPGHQADPVRSLRPHRRRN
ncbi:S1 RNA-binding domain-containing protein [Streptomyces anulatus]|uniref:S1 RNA-binding domain-containing protein n=1 Tax=Streptomyces anulatus TaxID=1892 RepID=UPI0036DBBAF6